MLHPGVMVTTRLAVTARHLLFMLSAQLAVLPKGDATDVGSGIDCKRQHVTGRRLAR